MRDTAAVLELKKLEREKLEREFETLWRQIDGQELKPEVRFSSEKKSRFDRAHLPAMIAIEIDGATWKKGGGRHNLEPGYSNDCEKINLAQSMGWLVFRLTGPMLKNNPHYHLTMIKDTIARRLRLLVD